MAKLGRVPDHLLAVLLLTLASTTTDGRNAMSAAPFLGIPGVIELECSGEVLDSDQTLVSMLLFTHRDGSILATVNIVNNECTTSAILSSCVITKQDTRRTKLKTLIMDLAANETRKYGCEISSVKSGARPKTEPWEFDVQGLRMSVRPFQGMLGIQELQCSGDVLSSDTTLLTMALYTLPRGGNPARGGRNSSSVFAFVNIMTSECTTSGVFSSCFIDRKDSRRTRLSALIKDLPEAETRVYGCEVNHVRTGQLSNVISWSLEVTAVSIVIQAFQGMESVQEVSCSGKELSSDTNVFSITLYSGGDMLAQVNVMTNECTTSGAFSSCVINERNSRETVLRTLVMEPDHSKVKDFVCEINSLKPGSRSQIFTWKRAITRARELFCHGRGFCLRSGSCRKLETCGESWCICSPAENWRPLLIHFTSVLVTFSCMFIMQGVVK